MSTARPEKKQSLEKVAFWNVFFAAAMLIFLMSCLEFVIYAYSLMQNYKRESNEDVGYAIRLIGAEYLDEIYQKTEDVYYSVPEEIRSQRFSDEYKQYLIPLVDQTFLNARFIMTSCREENNLGNVALVFVDEQNGRTVYVIDGDTNENAYLPGQWLSVKDAETETLESMKKIHDSNWRMFITYGSVSGWTATNYVDILDEEGNWLGYGVVDININDFFDKMFQFLRVFIPTVLLIVIYGAYRLSSLLRRRLITPINMLAGAAKEYTAQDKVNNSSATTVFNNLHLNTNDEIQDLWGTMVNMESDIHMTMDRIRMVTAEQEKLKGEQERLNNELAIATRIQEGILPRTFPAFPERNEFDIYASMTPALEVGGDFYDYFLIDDDHLALVIADVSGKGISAALFMVIAKTLIQNETLVRDGDVSAVLTSVNKRLIESNEADMFVTVWLAVLTISTGHVDYVNAGHEYPAIRHKDSKFEIYKDIHGMPVAAMSKTKFRHGEFTLDPGDTLFVYTDGVTDAINPESESFGIDRAIDALNVKPDGTPKEINDSVRSIIDEFRRDEPPFDDTTMVVFKYYGPQDDNIRESEENAALETMD